MSAKDTALLKQLCSMLAGNFKSQFGLSVHRLIVILFQLIFDRPNDRFTMDEFIESEKPKSSIVILRKRYLYLEPSFKKTNASLAQLVRALH